MQTESKTQVKVFLLPTELRLLRLAAANCGVSASTFLRQVGLAAADDEMRTFTPPTLPSGATDVTARKVRTRAK